MSINNYNSNIQYLSLASTLNRPDLRAVALLAVLAGSLSVAGCARELPRAGEFRPGVFSVSVNPYKIPEKANDPPWVQAFRVPADGSMLLFEDEPRVTDDLMTSVTASFPYYGSLPVGAPERYVAMKSGSIPDTGYAVSLAPVARWGVGLTQFELKKSDGSRFVFWVDIVGRSPLTTVIGVVAAVFLALGLLLAALHVWLDLKPVTGAWWLVVPSSALLFGLCFGIFFHEYGVRPLGLDLFGLCFVVVGLIAHFVSASVLKRTGSIRRRPPRPPKPRREPASRPWWLRLWMSILATFSKRPMASNRESPGAQTASTGPSQWTEPRVQARLALTGPEAIAAGVEFTLEVQRPEGWRLLLQRSGKDEIKLTIQLVAPGFTLAEGQRYRKEALIKSGPVAADVPLAVFRLAADPTSDGLAAEVRLVQTVLSAAGQMLGALERVLAVAADGDLLRQFQTTAPDQRRADLQTLAAALDDVTRELSRGHHLGTMEVPRMASPNPLDPDLSLWIRRSDPTAPGRLFFAMASRHTERLVPIPDRAPWSDISVPDARRFVRPFLEEIKTYSTQKNRTVSVEGTLETVAECVPETVWAALSAAGKQTGGQPPTVLISHGGAIHSVGAWPSCPCRSFRRSRPTSGSAKPWWAAG